MKAEKTFCYATKVRVLLYATAYPPSDLQFMTGIIVWNTPATEDSSTYMMLHYHYITMLHYQMCFP